METMPSTPNTHLDLQSISKQVMTQYGFEPDFPPEIAQQLAQLKTNPPKPTPGPDIRDLRILLWSSVDNDTSRDLDQIEYAERTSDGQIKVMVGIADVDAFVPKDSAIDKHAAIETTTVYTGVRIFPMLPEQLSTGTTSLLKNADKLSVVTEYLVGADGSVNSGNVAGLRNKAQLTYRPWAHGSKARQSLGRKLHHLLICKRS